jgi:hypothetical protein
VCRIPVEENRLHGFCLTASRRKRANGVLGDDGTLPFISTTSVLYLESHLFSLLIFHIKHRKMAEAVTTRTLYRIITVTAPMPPLTTPLIPEQSTSTTKSSTFYSSAPEVPPCSASSPKQALGTYVAATVTSVFAVIMFASLMAYLRKRWKMNRRRLGHED